MENTTLFVIYQQKLCNIITMVVI